MKANKETERKPTEQNTILFGTFSIRFVRDADTGSYSWFCLDDLIRATVRRPRNQIRALDILESNYENEIVQVGKYTENYINYRVLKQAMSMLRNKRMFSLQVYNDFLEWYQQNRPTLVTNSDIESEEVDQDWIHFVKNRKRKVQEEQEYLEEEEEEEDIELESAEEQEQVVEKLSAQELELRCKVLESLSITLAQVQDDNLKQILLVQINNLVNVIEYNLAQHPLYEADDTPVVRVTKRIQQLRPNISLEQIRQHRLEIGELAADKFFQVYGIRPPQFIGWANGQRRRINKYTQRTAERTLDVVIRHYEF